MEPTFRLFNFDSQSEDRVQEFKLSKLSVAEKEDENLYCFVCCEAITKNTYRTAVQGGYGHTLTNPAGYVFQIGCFQAAPGCSQAGNFTEEYTWFPGYSWRYAVCTSCHTHLGWCYRSREDDQFYGLILDRLISAAEKKNFPGPN